MELFSIRIQRTFQLVSTSRVITTLVEKDMEKKREVGKQEKV